MSKRGGESIDIEELEKNRRNARDNQKKRQEEEQEKIRRRAELQEKLRNKAEKAVEKRNKKSFWDEYSWYIIGGGIALVVLWVLFGKGPSDNRAHKDVPVSEEEYIYRVNAERRGYSLDTNEFFEGKTLEDVKGLFNTKFTNKPSVPKCPTSSIVISPKEKYNFVEKHPNCVGKIRDQGECGASHAFAATGVFSDRLCILNNDERKFNATAQHPLICGAGTSGCNGGFLVESAEVGLTGGFVDEACLPYKPENIGVCAVEPSCTKAPVASVCSISGTEAIKQQLKTGGPVAALMKVSREFFLYKEGMFDEKNVETPIDGFQAVKIVGWGTFYKLDYWIVENSWGKTWGKEGYAHVKINSDGSGIEEAALVIQPLAEPTNASE